MILFLITWDRTTLHPSYTRKDHFLCFAESLAGAKRQAKGNLLGDPDKWTITPLTNMGDSVLVHLSNGL